MGQTGQIPRWTLNVVILMCRIAYKGFIYCIKDLKSEAHKTMDCLSVITVLDLYNSQTPLRKQSDYRSGRTGEAVLLTSDPYVLLHIDDARDPELK